MGEGKDSGLESYIPRDTFFQIEGFFEISQIMNLVSLKATGKTFNASKELEINRQSVSLYRRYLEIAFLIKNFIIFLRKSKQALKSLI